MTRWEGGGETFVKNVNDARNKSWHDGMEGTSTSKIYYSNKIYAIK
jgi:hypothetical protein